MNESICGHDRETLKWALEQWRDNSGPESDIESAFARGVYCDINWSSGQACALRDCKEPTALVDLLQIAEWPRNVRRYHFEPAPNGVQIRWTKDGAWAWRRLEMPEVRALLLQILTMPETSRADDAIDALRAAS